MTAIFNREHEPPEPSEADAAYEMTREVVGFVPGAAFVLDQVFGSPFTRRQREWMNEIAAAIRRLEKERGIRPEELRDNPYFIDAAAAAYNAFVKTSDEAKRAALLNAVVNSALPRAPALIEQQIFISLVDRLTPVHLAVVGFFRAPASWRSPEGRSLRNYQQGFRTPRDVLEDAFPHLREPNRPLADVIWGDLHPVVSSGIFPSTTKARVPTVS
jgi:hypothetical protein